MHRGDQQDHSPLAGRASDVAKERLREDIRRQTADLRARLREAQMRSSFFIDAGVPDEAAKALEDQRAILSEYHDQLAQAVRSGLVEREAEQILAGAPDADRVLGTPALRVVDGGGASAKPPARPWVARVPVALGAAASFVALLALVATTLAPNDIGPTIAASGATASPDQAGAFDPPSPELTLREFRDGGVSDEELERLLAGVGISPEAREMIRRHREIRERLTEAAGRVSSLAELEALIEELLSEVPEFEGELGDLLVPSKAEAETSQDVEQPSEPSEPSDDAQPAPSEQPSDDASDDPDSDDGGLFGPWPGEDDPSEEEGGASEQPSDDGSSSEDGPLPDAPNGEPGQDDGSDPSESEADESSTDGPSDGSKTDDGSGGESGSGLTPPGSDSGEGESSGGEDSSMSLLPDDGG